MIMWRRGEGRGGLYCSGEKGLFCILHFSVLTGLGGGFPEHVMSDQCTFSLDNPILRIELATAESPSPCRAASLLVESWRDGPLLGRMIILVLCSLYCSMLVCLCLQLIPSLDHEKGGSS